LNRDELLASYMAAHILATTGTRVDASWETNDLLMAFNVLPKPRISFELWCARCGYAEQAPARRPRRKYTQAEILEINSKADRWFEERKQKAAS
jgi:hypothetical protein